MVDANMIAREEFRRSGYQTDFIERQKLKDLHDEFGNVSVSGRYAI